MGPSRDPVADGVHHVFPQWWVACGLCRRGVRGTASLAPCPPPGRRLLWSPWLGGCLWFRHWLSNGAALCGVWLVGSGACPVTDAIALENVWNSPLVGRGAPPVPRGLSFAVVRSGGRPCCAVFVWFHTTHSRTPSPWAHRAGSAPSPEECPSARRAPLSGAPALPLHTVPPVSSCVLPVLWCLLLLWKGLIPAPWLRSNPVPLRSRWSLLILARAASRPRKSRPQGRGYRPKTAFWGPHLREGRR